MRANKIFKNRGQAIVLVAVTLIVLLALAGLAIDSGISYGVKAKLSSAVDAAAIAAGRALGEGDTDVERVQNARDAAKKFYMANFPPGYLGATPKTLQDDDIVVVHNADGSWDITVTATATVPTYFLRVIGDKTFTTLATAETHKRDLDMSFVVDVTDSMKDVASDVKREAKTFINRFDASSDRVALIHFAYGAVVDIDVSSVRGFSKGDCDPSHHPPAGSVCGDIEHFDYNLGGFTNFSEAFWRARDRLNSIPAASRSSLRAIVFFTDGAPNSLSATFKHGSSAYTGVLRTQASPSTPDGLWRVAVQNQTAPSPWNQGTNINAYIDGHKLPKYFNCTPGNTDPNADKEFPIWPHGAKGRRQPVPDNPDSNYANDNRSARNLPEDMAQSAKQQGIFVFTLGLGSHLHDGTGQDNETGETILMRMANDPRADTYDPSLPVGLYCFAADTSQLDACFTAVANQILRLTK